MKISKRNRKRGAALVEYGLLVAGVALTTAAAVSILGHKTNDLIGTVAGALPSSNESDVGQILGGRLIATQNEGGIISANYAEQSSFDELYGTGAGGMIHDKQYPDEGGSGE